MYCAESRSLAVLEVLVHYAILPRDFAMTRIEFEDTIVTDVQALPRNWLTDPDATRAIGKRWHDSLLSAVLRVPSSVEPVEHNFVLNPDHPDFARIKFEAPKIYRFDPRLRR